MHGSHRRSAGRGQRSIADSQQQRRADFFPLSTARKHKRYRKLDPASATEEVIFVAAKQTFSGGPTVIVRSQAADLCPALTR